MSGNVRPHLLLRDTNNGSCRYIEGRHYLRNFDAVLSHRPNGAHFNGRQFSIRTARMVPSAFSFSVLGVGRVRAKEQMFWIAARGIVAGMEDVHSRWNRAVGLLPRDTRGQMHFPVKLELTDPSPRIAISRPWPASVFPSGFVHGVPEVRYPWSDACKSVIQCALVVTLTHSTPQYRSIASVHGACFSYVSHRRGSFSSSVRDGFRWKQNPSRLYAFGHGDSPEWGRE